MGIQGFSKGRLRTVTPDNTKPKTQSSTGGITDVIGRAMDERRVGITGNKNKGPDNNEWS